MKELSEVLKDWEAVIGWRSTPSSRRSTPRCSATASSATTMSRTPTVPGVSGPARRTARTQQTRHREHREGRFGHQLPNPEALDVLSQALLLSGYGEELPDHPGPVAFCMHGRLDLEVTGRGAAERPDCAFGEAESLSLASASANAEGLSTAMAQRCAKVGSPPARLRL